MLKTFSYALAFLASSLIFVGLPLLGWGLGAIPQFFQSPARLVYVIVIAALQLLALLYNPQVGRTRGDAKSEDKRPKLDLLLIQIFSLAIVFVAPLSDRLAWGTLPLGEGTRFIGFVLFIPGFLLMQMAQKYLDRQFSIEVTLQDNHQLVRQGPYRWIRHPRYLGILVFFLGIVLVFRSWLGMAVVAALLLVLVWRIGAEEALMQQQFGRDWDEYCRESWRMIPFVY
jgi:protein-S-isoprenylcysteine O-methyltransferase Ste14